MLIYNLFTMLSGGLYKDSIYNMAYFFGIRVNINDVWPFSIAIMLVSACYGGKLSKILCGVGIVSGLIFIIAQWVSTAIVTTLIFAIIFFYVLASHRWEARKKQLRIVAIFLMVWIVWFAFNPDVQRFSWLIEDTLGESLTLDGRTEIWQSCLNQIQGVSWIIGHGYGNGYVFGLSNGMELTHPHNQYLAILFNFGIIGLLIYAKLIIDQIKKFMSSNVNIISAIIGACLIASMVMGIGATFYNKIYWIIWYTLCMALIENEEENFEEDREYDVSLQD